ncbi:hypothetical protein [Nocardia sp. NPDC051463]|uniref:hypothetical protein n=1 Tax=Nocardia sp. NPDC051463 TaxID=3154845 RepID=UPI003450695C
MGGSGHGAITAEMVQAANRVAEALVYKAALQISKVHREFSHEIPNSLERFQHKDEHLAREIDRIRNGPAARTDRDTVTEHPESGANTRGPVRGPDPTAEDGFLDLPIEDQIRRLEEAHGIRTDAERALEISLFMEDKFRDIAYISGQARPETVFDGPEGWASWLDARLFARRNLDREISVDLIQEIHYRLIIRKNAARAGELGPGGKGMAVLSQPLSRSERAAIEENPLLTHVPGPFRSEPYGVVLYPKVEGQPGRAARWLTEPPSDVELAAIRDDPLLSYVRPGWIRSNNQGIILYPNFGSVDNANAFHGSLCGRYNDATGRPGFSPYQSAAEFQRQFISAHAWIGDYHGRHSRILMNHLLERAGKPPAAVAEFDNDMLTSPSQWADAVEAGSNRYGHWQDKIERSGGDIEPVDLFDLGPMQQLYPQMGGEPSPFASGEKHDVAKYGELHRQLRLASEE